MTIKPLVRILHVKLSGKEHKCMYAELNEKVKFELFYSTGLRGVAKLRRAPDKWKQSGTRNIPLIGHLSDVMR